MKTLTITQARATLGEICEWAKTGKDVGIISGNQVLQLVPIEVKPFIPGEVVLVPLTEERAAKAYGVTASEFAAFRKQRNVEYAREKRTGTLRRFSGDLEKDIRD